MVAESLEEAARELRDWSSKMQNEEKKLFNSNPLKKKKKICTEKSHCNEKKLKNQMHHKHTLSQGNQRKKKSKEKMPYI